MSESVAAHYGDAPDDFVVAHSVELPWPSAQGDVGWERRVLSLKDISRGSYWPFVCGIKMWGQKKTSGGGGVEIQTPSPGLTVVSEGMGRGKEMARLPGGVVAGAVERVPAQAGRKDLECPSGLCRRRGAPGVCV